MFSARNRVSVLRRRPLPLFTTALLHVRRLARWGKVAANDRRVKFIFKPAAQSGSCVNLQCVGNIDLGEGAVQTVMEEARVGGESAARKPIIVLKFDTSEPPAPL